MGKSVVLFTANLVNVEHYIGISREGMSVIEFILDYMFSTSGSVARIFEPQCELLAIY